MRNGWWVPAAVVLVACLESDSLPPLELPAAAQPTAAATAAPSSDAEAFALPDMIESEEDIERLRDPFQAPPPEPPPIDDPRPMTDVVFRDTNIEQLILKGTASTGRDGHALLATQSGASKVVDVGTKVGTPNRGPDGSVRQWRVDRIKDGELFLIEQGAPTTQPARTRSLAIAKS